MIYEFLTSEDCGHTHVNVNMIVKVSRSNRKPPDGLPSLSLLTLAAGGFIDGVSWGDMQNIEALSRALPHAASAYLDALTGGR